jgi:hypothetical protein
MTEDELGAEVATLANDLGIWWHHCRDSRYCQGVAGLPDLLLIGDRGLMFAELKGDNGRSSRQQLRYAARLMQAGAKYQLWTPEQWRAGWVRRRLQAIS